MKENKLRMNNRILILIVACISLSIIILFLANRSTPGLQINPSALIIDSISSVFRMFAALVISFLVALIVGITAARKRTASKVIIPILAIPVAMLLSSRIVSSTL